MEEKCKQLKIKDWYKGEYPTDNLGDRIKEDTTFYDIFYALDNYKDIYDIIGVTDSLARERIFEKLAELMEVDYDYIYDQWLRS